MPIESSNQQDAGKWPNGRWPGTGLCLGVVGCLALLLGLVAWQGEAFNRAKGVTFDETFYLNAGIRVYRHGDFGALARMGVAPLPVLTTHWVGPLMLSKDVPDDKDALWELSPGDSTAIRMARRFYWLFGFGLLAVVFVWLGRRRGLFAGLVGAGLVGLSPVVVANASIATTDVALGLVTLAALASMASYHRRPTWTRLVLVAILLGLAIATKYSALLLVPLAVATTFDAARRNVDGARPWSLAVLKAWLPRLAILAAVALLVCVALHGGDPLGLVRGLRRQIKHNRYGHAAFLCGARSTTGWWYYFPVAVLLKSTPVELLLGLVGVLLVPRWLARQWGAKSVDPAPALWLAAVALFGIMAISCRVNIGIRYLLPVYPLMVMWAIDQGNCLLADRRRLALGLGAALLALQAAVAWQIRPDYLSYFNALAGGPRGGHRYLVDSNLDWGQDLPYLAKTLDQLEGKTVVLHYFGTDKPAHYGIEAEPWTRDIGPTARAADVLAISATHLAGAYGEERDSFCAFRRLEPIDRAGYSILLFDLNSDAGSRALEIALKRNRAAGSDRSSTASKPDR